MVGSNRRKTRKERGQTLAEFALIAPLLVILIFGFVDAARLYHAWVTIEGAAREGARYGVTGRTDCAAPSPTRTTCIQYNASQRAKKLTNASSDLTVTMRSWNYPNYTNPAIEGNPGDQCDALEVQVDYDFTPAVFSQVFGSIHIVGRERLVNEPFGTCN